MKVCTDSCIFGSWVFEPNAGNILDIGTGTGLLTLMLAQRHDAYIDAVEIDESAYLQALTNIRNSPWRNRISVYHADIRHFSPPSGSLYDMIICNPPFFKSHLHSPDKKRNGVLHDDFLSLEDLADRVKKLLSPDGAFYVMLPPYETSRLVNLMERINLWPHKILHLKENSAKNRFRELTKFCYEYAIPDEHDLIVRDTSFNYTEDFNQLLKDYYLNI